MRDARKEQDAYDLARAVYSAMYARDRAAQHLGIRLLDIHPGYALMTMTVTAEMVNGHHICHGGLLFALADTAFAYACNSYNKNTVAAACNIDFLSPAKEGDVLEAEAVERSLAGRTGVYDVIVRTKHARVVALFRGKSYRITGEVIAGLEAVHSDSDKGGDNASQETPTRRSRPD